jgi:hypothetical protein
LVSVFCGIDWAEDHHDIALVDQDGTLRAKRRISDDAAGFAALLQLLVEAGDDPDTPIPVAIETSRGLLVACPRACGCQNAAHVTRPAGTRGAVPPSDGVRPGRRPLGEWSEGSGLAECPVRPVAVVVVLVLGQHRCGVPLVDEQGVVE